MMPATRQSPSPTEKVVSMNNHKKYRGIRSMLAGLATSVALLSTPVLAQEVSDGVVKIGVLTDMSGVFSDMNGNGSVVAAQLGVEDFGGSVLGKPIQLVSADHQHKADVGT